ncbi:MAG: Ig-like domain-containing protein, partial [Magnetospirillum sp. WYHS-4]
MRISPGRARSASQRPSRADRSSRHADEANAATATAQAKASDTDANTLDATQTSDAAATAIKAKIAAINADPNTSSVAKDLAAKASVAVDDAQAYIKTAGQQVDNAHKSLAEAQAQYDLATAGVEQMVGLKTTANTAEIASADIKAEGAAKAAEDSRDQAISHAMNAMATAKAAMAIADTALNKMEAFAAGKSYFSQIDAAHTAATDALATITGIVANPTATAGADIASAIDTVVTVLGTALDATNQEARLTLGGRIETGDTYAVTVNGTPVTYNVPGGVGTTAGARDALVAAINANGTVSGAVTASAGFADGEIVLTAKTVGGTFTVSASAANHGATADNTVTVVSTGLDSALAALRDGLDFASDVANTVQGAVTAATNAASTARQDATDLLPANYNAAQDASVTAANALAADAVAEAQTAADAAATAQAQAFVSTQALAQATSAAASFEQYLTKATQEAALSTARDAANAVPNAVNDAASVNEDATIAVSPLANDLRADGNALAGASITSVGAAAHGTVKILPQIDTLILSGAVEAGDKYTVTVNGKAVTYTVTGGEANLAAVTTAFLNAIKADLTVSSVVTATPGSGTGQIVLTAAKAGVPFNAASSHVDNGGNASGLTLDHTQVNGQILYTPTANYNGTDSFTYTVSNNANPPSFGTATVNLTVASVNDGPVAKADYATTAGDTAKATFSLLGNDTDVDGDTLAFTSVAGTNVTTVGQVITLASGATLKIETGGSVTFDPNGKYGHLRAGQTAQESFIYVVNDGHGGTSTATAVVTVTGTNAMPAAVAATGSGNEDTPITGTLSATDADAGDSLIFSLAAGGAPTHGEVTINANGTYSYTPTANYSGADSFTYRIQDASGASSTAKVNLTVAAVNDAPVAVADSGTVAAGGNVTLRVLANDSDIEGDTLTLASVAEGTYGTAVKSGFTVVYTADKSPALALAEGATATDTFTYTASDGQGGTTTQTVTVTVTGANHAPILANDTASTTEDAQVVLSPLVNDVDPDGDTLTYVTVNQGSKGTVTSGANGTLVYKPNLAAVNHLNAGETLTDTIQYSVSDGNTGHIGSAVVTVTIDGANDAPVAVGDSASANVLQVLSVDKAHGVLANDTDPDRDDTFSVTSYTATTTKGATVVVNADGSFSYDPTASATLRAVPLGTAATDSFTYTVTDAHGATATATVQVGVLGSAGLTLTGAAGTDHLVGTASEDTLGGGAGNDTLYGMEANDLLDGGPGDDVILGHGGIDTLTFQDATGGVTVDLSVTTAQSVGGGMGVDTIFDIENATGTAFGDTLTGNTGDNLLRGMEGDDVLNGGQGKDALEGGAGNDILLGGAGDDTLFGGAGDDVLHFGDGDFAHGGTGTDRLVFDQAASGLALVDASPYYSGIEIVDMGDRSGSLSVTAEAVAALSDTDSLLVRGGASDTVEATDAGWTLAGTETIDAEQYRVFTKDGATLKVDADIGLTGLSADLTLTGTAGDDTLSGGPGDDILYGGVAIQALDLNGDDGRALINDGGTLNFPEVTLAAWVNFDTVRYSNIVARTASSQMSAEGVIGDNLGVHLALLADGRLEAYAWDGGQKRADGLTTVEADTWYHVALTVGGGQLKLFVDGVEEASTAIGALDYQAMNMFAVGSARQANFNIGWLDGQVSDVAVWNRALSAGEIGTVIGTGPDASDTGLKGFWTFGEEANPGAAEVGPDAILGGGAALAEMFSPASSGNDVLIGGAGNDLLDGGDGTDLVSYANATAAVTVDLAQGTASGGAGTDSLSNIE